MESLHNTAYSDYCYQAARNIMAAIGQSNEQFDIAVSKAAKEHNIEEAHILEAIAILLHPATSTK